MGIPRRTSFHCAGLGLGPREHSRLGRNDAFQEKRRLQDVDPLAFELARHTPQQLVIVAALHSGQEHQPSRIGPEIGKQPYFSDAACHDGVADLGLSEGTDDLSQLPYPNPGDLLHELFDLFGGLPAMRHRDHPDPDLTRVLGEYQGKPAAAGDQADLVHGHVGNRVHQRQIPRWELSTKRIICSTSRVRGTSRQTLCTASVNRNLD